MVEKFANLLIIRLYRNGLTMRKVICFLTICLCITGCAPTTKITQETTPSTTRIFQPTITSPTKIFQTSIVPTIEFSNPNIFPSNGMKIVFVSDRNGNPEIYTMNPDGSNQVRLTVSPFIDGGPTWSSDSQKIAFYTERDGNYEIYSMSVDGTNLINLTNNPWDDENPDWSPDMTKIVYDSIRDGNYEIYLMNADGSNQTRLTDNPDYDGIPRWSPDGKYIAFTSIRNGNMDIYVMNSDGSNQIALTDHPADDISTVWSPDGKRIAFDTNRDGEWQLYTISTDGTNLTRITYDVPYYGFADWSDDGEKFVFLYDNGQTYDIHSMDAEGKNISTLVSLASNDYDPRWSPGTTTVTLSNITNPTDNSTSTAIPSTTSTLVSPGQTSAVLSNQGGVILGWGTTQFLLYGQRSGTGVEESQIVNSTTLDEVKSQFGVQKTLSGNGLPLFAYFPNQPFTNSDGTTALADVSVGSTDDPNISIGFLWTSEIDGIFPTRKVTEAQMELFSVQSNQPLELEGWLKFGKLWLANNTGKTDTSQENLDFLLFHNGQDIYILGFLPDYQYNLPATDLSGPAPAARSGEKHSYLIKGFLGGKVSIPLGNMTLIPVPIFQVSSIEWRN